MATRGAGGVAGGAGLGARAVDRAELVCRFLHAAVGKAAVLRGVIDARRQRQLDLGERLEG